MKSTALKKDLLPDSDSAGERRLRQTDKQQAAMPVWSGPDYPRIAPGRYTACAERILGPQYLRRWQRWSLGIGFRLIAEPEAEVVLFLNLGRDIKPKRGSDFFRAWTQANGGLPMKGQQMDPGVFLEGQVYEIEVVDAEMDSEGTHKSEAEVYSKVRRIFSVLRNGTEHAGVVPIKRS